MDMDFEKTVLKGANGSEEEINEAKMTTSSPILDDNTANPGQSAQLPAMPPSAAVAIEVVQPEMPTSKAEMADEFRTDAELDPYSLTDHFYCCVCGSPAGKDTFCCKVNGHPVCALCQAELHIEECPFMIRSSEGRLFICKSAVYQFSSVFRNFMFDNTVIRCIHSHAGCQVTGTWEVVKQHQESCTFFK